MVAIDPPSPLLHLARMGLSRILLLSLFAGSSAFAASAQQASAQWRTNPEYGFKVGFPAGFPVCVNGSWNHAHGWGMLFAGTCEKPVERRAIAVHADFNASFSSLEKAAYCPNDSGSALVDGARFQIEFKDHKTLVCRSDRPNGEILVTVVAQGGQWCQPDQGAYINYYGTLETTKPHFDRDVVTLRKILRTVQLIPPKPVC